MISGRLETIDRELLLCLRESRSIVKRTYTEWLEEVFCIPTGLYKGERFSFDTQPVERLWADCIDSGNWTEFVRTGPSQCGKSLMGYVSPTVYHLHELRDDVVMGVPMADMGAMKWERDFLPVLNASPDLRGLIPISGSGSGGGKIRDMVTLGNQQVMKIMSAGGDDVNKAAFTGRVVAITEAARFSEGAESSVEADPFAQLQARQRAYPEALRRTYIEGTLTIEEELPWSLRETSTKSQIVTPCPHCGQYVLPGREHLRGWQEAKTDKEARDAAYFVCPQCEEKITDEQRVRSVRNCRIVHDGQTIDKKGRVRGPIPNTLRLWFHVQAWHNLLLKAGDVAVDEWKASKIPDDSPRYEINQRKLCQFVWAVPYVPPRSENVQIDSKELWQRQLPYPRQPDEPSLPRGKAPADTVYLTTGVDMGSRIGWYVTLAIRSNQMIHVVDYDSFEVPSETLGLDNAFIYSLQQLRDMLQAGYITEDGRTLSPKQVWVDAGYCPAAVLEFVRQSGTSRKGWIFAALGRGQTQMNRTNYLAPKRTGNEVREIDQDGLWHLSYVPSKRSWEITFDADTFKLMVQAGLVCDLGNPGAITLFAGTKQTHYRIAAHWTNEQLRERWDPKKGLVKEWHKKGQNHLLDATGNALGAAVRVGYSPIRIVEEVHDPNPPQASAIEPAKPQPTATTKNKTSSSWYSSQRDVDE